MSQEQSGKSEEVGSRKTTAIGFWMSAAYIVGLVAFIFFGRSFGWVNLSDGLTINEIGDFLAGAFSPLAFLWLVLGFLQQGRELRLQVREMAQSVLQQKELVGVTKETLDHEREVMLAQRDAERARYKPKLRIRLANNRRLNSKLDRGDGTFSNVRQIEVLITNAGSRLTDLDLELSPPTKTAKRRVLPLLESGAEVRQSVEFADDDDQPDKLIVFCTSEDGVQHKHTFAINAAPGYMDLFEETIIL